MQNLQPSRKKFKISSPNPHTISESIHLKVRLKLIESMDGTRVTQLYNSLANFENRKILRSKGSDPQNPLRNHRTWFLQVFKKCTRACVLKYEDTIIFDSYNQGIETLRQYPFRILPKKEPACVNMRKFVKNMISSRSTELLEDVAVVFEAVTGKREKAGKTKKEKRECLNEWVYNALFGMESAREKREKESKSQVDINSLLFRVCGFDVPFDIVKLVCGFLVKDYCLLDGVGLVNSQWHLMVLSSWKKIKLTFHNVYLIPLIVMNRVENVTLSTTKTRLLTSSGKISLEYMFKNLRNVRRVQFENSGMEETFRRMCQRGGDLTKNIDTVDFSIKPFGKGGQVFCLSSCHCKWIERTNMKVNAMSFALDLKNNVLNECTSFFNRLEKLKFYANSSGNDYLFSVPSIPNLTELNISGVFLNPKCFNVIEKMSKLKKLEFVAHADIPVDWKIFRKIENLSVAVLTNPNSESNYLTKGYFDGLSGLRNLRVFQVILTENVPKSREFIFRNHFPPFLKEAFVKISSLPKSIFKIIIFEQGNVCGMLNDDKFREVEKKYRNLAVLLYRGRKPCYRVLDGWIPTYL